MTDDTAYLQSLINASFVGPSRSGVTGARLSLPSREFVISDTLDFYQWSGLVEGQGVGNSPAYTPDPGGATVIRWAGVAGKPMVRCRDYMALSFEGIRFEGSNAAPPSYAIESTNVAGDGAGTGARLVVDRCALGTYVWSSQGINQGAIQAGIGFTGDNTNNDEFHISNTLIAPVERGLYVPNSQSIWGYLSNTTFHSAGIAGIDTWASMTGTNVSFDDCARDIRVNSTARVNIFGHWSERSKCNLEITTFGRANIHGGKWLLSPAMTGPFFLASGVTTQAGALLTGLEIDNQTGGAHPKLYMRSGGGGQADPGRLTFIDCISKMTLADFDVASTPSNALEVKIMSGSLNLHRRLRHAETLAGDGFRFSGFGESPEVVNPGAPTTMDGIKAGRWFFRNNNGTTEFCVQFATGVAIVLASENKAACPVIYGGSGM